MLLLAFLPILSFILLFVLFYIKCKSISASIARTWLCITLFIWASTELLSVFKLWTSAAMITLWVLVLASLCFIFFRSKSHSKLREYFRSENNIVQTLRQYKICMIAMTVFFLFITVTALLRSQNLIDALVYRLPRIMHWMQNQSVGFYASHTDLQFRYPALTEYLVAQFYLLGCPDRIANIVHVCAYSCSVVMVYGISRKLNVSKGLSLFASWIYMLIPVAIIQTYTIQSDIIGGLYLLIFIYLLLDFIQAPKLVMDKSGFFSAIGLASCVLLGYLCKPTVCFIMVIFFIWMVITRLLRKDRPIVLLKYVLVGGITAIILYLPLLARNYESYLLPDRDASSIAEEAVENTTTEAVTTDAGSFIEETGSALAPDSFNVVRALTDPIEFFMTCLQNFGRNAASICFPKYNEFIEKVIGKMGGILNYDVSDFAIHPDGSSFFGETAASNPAIMIFTLLLVICLLFRLCKTNRFQTIYLICSIAGLIFQSGLMGFTLYRSRYLLGIMAVLCPALALCIEKLKTNGVCKQRIMTILIVIASFGGINALSYQVSYMIDGLRGESIHQYFVWNTTPEYYYDLLCRELNERGYKTIGLNDKISLEYVIWQEVDDYERIDSVNVNAPWLTTISKYEDTAFVPECLIEENPYEVKLGDIVECHGKKYTCIWMTFGSNKYYAIYDLNTK